MTDAIQRFVGIATPVARIAFRGARFTRVPWVLVASSAVSIGVTVRNGVRELQAIAALLTHRFEQETGTSPDPALLRKLTLELYLKPRRAPDVVGSRPAAHPARPTLDRERRARSEHPEEDREGARCGGASRPDPLTRPASVYRPPVGGASRRIATYSARGERRSTAPWPCRRGRACSVLPGPRRRACMARSAGGSSGRGSLCAGDRTRGRPRARRCVARGDRTIARASPSPRAHRRRARSERGAGAPRHRGAGSPQTLELTDRVLASDEMQRVVRHVASSPELRAAIAQQTTGLAEEVVGGVRASAVRLDDRAELVVRRRPRADPTVYARDRDPCDSACDRRSPDARPPDGDNGRGCAHLVSRRRAAPGMAGWCAAWFRLAAARGNVLRSVLERRRPDTRHAAAAVARSWSRGGPLPPWARSLVRLIGLVLAIVPFFAGFIPVLFTERRRGLPDLLAGTVVIYDGLPPSSS